jgi:DivIVA domain-containing protein
MSIEQSPQGYRERRLSPADVRGVQFGRGTMLRTGYNDVEVDRFLDRVAEELASLHSEKAELRDQVNALREQVVGAASVEPPSEQAVRILATAQQTADSYVAEAEDFSRQMSADARSRYEEELRNAREQAGAIIQAAQEAASRMVAEGETPAGEPDPAGMTKEQLEEQVAYLRAFAQACRVQLRSYLEALLTDVENEWGRANPGGLPEAPIRTPAQRAEPAVTEKRQPAQTSGRRRAPENVAREMPLSDSTSEHPIVTADGTVEMVDRRR